MTENFFDFDDSGYGFPFVTILSAALYDRIFIGMSLALIDASRGITSTLSSFVKAYVAAGPRN